MHRCVEIATRPIQSGSILTALSCEPSRFTHWAVRIEEPPDGVGVQIEGDKRHWVYYEIVKKKIEGENKIEATLRKSGRKIERLADVSGIPLGSTSLSEEADLRFAGARSETPDGLVDVFDNRPEKAFRPLPQEEPVCGIVDLETLDDIDKTARCLFEQMPRKYHLLNNNCQDYAVHLFLKLFWSFKLLAQFSSYLNIKKTASGGIKQGGWGYTYEVMGRISNIHIVTTKWVSIETLDRDRLVDTCLVDSSVDIELAIEDVIGCRTIHHKVYDRGKVVWSWTREYNMSREQWFTMKRREEKEIRDMMLERSPGRDKWPRPEEPPEF